MLWLILGIIFITITLTVYGFLSYWDKRRKVKGRFTNPEPLSSLSLLQSEEKREGGKHRFLNWLSFSGQWAMKDQKEVSKVRVTLVQAGYPQPNAPAIYFGLRVLAALALPVPVVAICITQGRSSLSTMLIGFLVSGMGFFLPSYLLNFLARKRQNSIDKALPDVLDLFIICMEAGLALNATINRVALEIRGVYDDFYNELRITTTELRTGIPWNEALNNLGQRTGVQSVKSLVALMIQSEKLGASIAQALRTHADFVRVQRTLKVEEKAAKLPVKILFPLMFFILPALFIVIIGPAIIHITETVLSAMGGK